MNKDFLYIYTNNLPSYIRSLYTSKPLLNMNIRSLKHPTDQKSPKYESDINIRSLSSYSFMTYCMEDGE
jgi:hypothetical protein